MMGTPRKALAWTSGLIGLALAGWGGYSWVTGSLTRDEEISRSLSPDGEFLAIVRNFDSASASFAYVTLEPAKGGWFSRPERVAELEGNDLHEILWEDGRTLLVRVSVDRAVGSTLASQFTTKQDRWRDVSIRYEATRELQSENGEYHGWGGPSRVRGRR